MLTRSDGEVYERATGHFVRLIQSDIHLITWTYLAPVVQTVDNAIHRINHYPLDIAIGFAITYPVDSDLSGG